ncbi:MAG: GPW/gp25 family protein [Deferribacterales bacterium]|nr:GPW/gp25 family protein [Deferribacterales bacterium]
MERINKVKYGDFFSPCFLSKITDKEPHQRTERYNRAMSLAQIKQDILLNIRMILNSKSRASNAEFGGDKAVLSSVLCFGLYDFCGENKSDASMERIKDGIVEQLVYFEPRLDPLSIQVKISDNNEDLKYICELEISGVISVEGVSDEILLKSSLDLETGAVWVDFAE